MSVPTSQCALGFTRIATDATANSESGGVTLEVRVLSRENMNRLSTDSVLLPKWRRGTGTLVLEVEGGQSGLDHPGGKPAASGGLAKVLLHPLKHPGVGVARSAVFMEVCDAGPVCTEPQSVHRVEPRVSLSALI